MAVVVQPSDPALDRLDPGTVITAVRERLAGHKVPRTVLIAPVPRAPNGKVLFGDCLPADQVRGPGQHHREVPGFFRCQPDQPIAAADVYRDLDRR